jgi:hypothetical protein
MEIVRKTLKTEDAIGWYLLKTEKRHWIETFEDEETGEKAEIEKSEPICGKGTQINEIIASSLTENGILQVDVSDVPVLGEQDKNTTIWETAMNVKYKTGKHTKTSYYTTAESPASVEKFISEYFELNVDAVFELTKVNKLEFNKIIKMYETEKDEFEKDKSKKVNWYRCQIYSMVDDDGESKNAGTKNILVQATSFENAISAVKLVMNQDEYDSIYNTIKLMQELNIIDVFIPDEMVVYYSTEEVFDNLDKEAHQRRIEFATAQ